MPNVDGEFNGDILVFSRANAFSADIAEGMSTGDVDGVGLSSARGCEFA
jgi:hypothetical protein